MSADRLRRVAAEMRKKAEAATYVYTATGDPVPWHTVESLHPEWDGEDAAHIAAWHPAVALAVADWLDDEAKTAQRQLNAWPVSPHALAVCDAWEAGR